MAKIEIDRERCKGCGLCTISCPKELIRMGEEINRQGHFFVIWEDNGGCTGCAVCEEICPDVAIRFGDNHKRPLQNAICKMKNE